MHYPRFLWQKTGVNLYFHRYSYSFNHEPLSQSSFIPLPHSHPPSHLLKQTCRPGMDTLAGATMAEYQATLSHQVLISCFYPGVNARTHDLQGCLITYSTVKICLIPSQTSCSCKPGTTKVRAGRELKRSFPKLPGHTSCPIDVHLT